MVITAREGSEDKGPHRLQVSVGIFIFIFLPIRITYR